MIGVVDLGSGNLRSVQAAFSYLGHRSSILASPSEMAGIDRLVLPGVGSFGHAVRMIEEGFWRSPLKTWMEENRPFLGICLGMQLLFDSSAESDGAGGFGFLQGACVRFSQHKVPQIGWNVIHVQKESGLLLGIPSGSHFYFVHSYFAVPVSGHDILAETDYGVRYSSVVGRDRVYGVQFHPEKSGGIGLRLLHNWVSKC